jgi:ABC-type branched-subunit amino acid transport system substrate-binding protein
MPWYRLTREQAADLVAYLEVLGRETDPGVTDTGLRIGVVLPPASILGASVAMREVITAYARQVNDQGGLYGRQLALSFLTAPDEVASRAGAIRDFIESAQPFALVSSYVAGCEDEIGPYLEANEVPVIGPICLYAGGEPLEHRHVFHILSGLAGQGKALARFAIQRPEIGHRAVLVSRDGDEEVRAVIESVGKLLVAAGWSAPREIAVKDSSKPDWGDLLSADTAGVVFWFAPAAGLDDFYRSATAAGVHPFLLAPSTLAGRELLSAPDAFDGRVFCWFPALPSDQTPVGRDELMKLANDAHFSDGSFTRIALSSAKLLVHGLRQTGREVSREKLVDVLEHLSGYNSEQTPAVSFAALPSTSPK